jgi:hypothetical protein
MVDGKLRPTFGTGESVPVHEEGRSRIAKDEAYKASRPRGFYSPTSLKLEVCLECVRKTANSSATVNSFPIEAQACPGRTFRTLGALVRELFFVRSLHAHSDGPISECANEVRVIGQ